MRAAPQLSFRASTFIETTKRPVLQAEILGLVPNGSASSSVGEPCVEAASSETGIPGAARGGGMTGRRDRYFAEGPIRNSVRIPVLSQPQIPLSGSGKQWSLSTLLPHTQPPADTEWLEQVPVLSTGASRAPLGAAPAGDITANSHVGTSYVTFPTEEPLAKSLSCCMVFLGTDGLILA